MLTVAIPNKGSPFDGVASMLKEAGYRSRPDGRDLTMVDQVNGVCFYFLRPRDVAVYVGRGDIDLGLTGRDLALDSGVHVTEVLSLGFGASTFRYAGEAGREWAIEDIVGQRVATSYPGLVRADLERRSLYAEIVRLDGAVEVAIELGVADVVADVVSTGRTLAAHGLSTFGPVICESEAVVIERSASAAGGTFVLEDAPARRQLIRRLEGVVVAQQYVMVDYDCPRDLLDVAVSLTDWSRRRSLR